MSVPKMGKGKGRRRRQVESGQLLHVQAPLHLTRRRRRRKLFTDDDDDIKLSEKLNWKLNKE